MRTAILGLALLVLGATARAQGVSSVGVTLYRNNLPADVLFMFPLNPSSNILNIFIGCNYSPMPNQIFVYEEQPDRSIKLYQFENVPVNCNQNYTSEDTVFTGSLQDKVRVATPDHIITIDSAAWTAVKGSRDVWHATGGSATLTVN